MHSSGLDDDPRYRDLSFRVASAIAATEAAGLEARCRRELTRKGLDR